MEKGRSAIRFVKGQNNLFGLTTDTWWQNYAPVEKSSMKESYVPRTTHPSKRCQTLCVHPCREEEEVKSTPKGNGGHHWPVRLPTTPGKGRMESMCLDPHPNQKKTQKSVTVLGGVRVKWLVGPGGGLRGVGDGGYQTGAPRGTFGEEEPCTMSPATNRCSLIWLWIHE